jgi:hypothetical protein
MCLRDILRKEINADLWLCESIGFLDYLVGDTIKAGTHDARYIPRVSR